MSKQKLRVNNTQLDNLISNLRGEVGEVITSWVLLRHMMARERELTSDDIAKDLANENLAFVSILRERSWPMKSWRGCQSWRSQDRPADIYFAATKLGKLDAEVRGFKTFITREKFQQKRNLDISHKELPEKWARHGPVVIPYRTLRRGVGHALHLMKRLTASCWDPPQNISGRKCGRSDTSS